MVETRTYSPKSCKRCNIVFQPTGAQKLCAGCRETCQVQGCKGKVRVGGLCAGHARKVHPVEAISLRPGGLCGVEDCIRAAVTKGRCIFHYSRVRHYAADGASMPQERKAAKVPCAIEGCVRKAQGAGLCQMHYRRQRLKGDAGVAQPGKAAKGEGSVTSDGYRKIKPHRDEAHIFEHRYVMEKVLGRKLRRGENVHHRDGDRLNNDLSNLELWTVQQPSGQRVTDKFEWALKFIRSHPTLMREHGVELVALESARASEVLERKLQEEFGTLTVSEAISGIAGLI